ncbi:MAG: response regulator [Parvularculaceae bacterium]
MKSCVIIEDSEVIREIASRIVKEFGVEPIEADSASAGLEICRERQVDVAMLDWDLPSMGALDFLRGAAELDPAKKPQIVLCATENDAKQFALARAAGAAHHLLKPYDQRSIARTFVEIEIVDADAVGDALKDEPKAAEA